MFASRESCFIRRFFCNNSKSQVLGKQGWELLHANPIVRVNICNISTCKLCQGEFLQSFNMQIV